MPEMPCAECGGPFTPKTSQGRFCSAACRYRFRDKGAAKKAYESSPKRKAAAAARQREVYRQRAAEVGRGQRLAAWAKAGAGMGNMPETCSIDGCGKASFSRAKCRGHYAVEMAEAGAEWAREYLVASGSHHRRRAERFGADWEPVVPMEIFDRDEWRCGLCGGGVDRSLLYPHPMSASLDHVVPLAAGGHHVPSNLQCSHLTCNVRKGARHGERAEAPAGVA